MVRIGPADILSDTTHFQLCAQNVIDMSCTLLLNVLFSDDAWLVWMLLHTSAKKNLVRVQSL